MSRALRTLLSSIVDYAGLFPPAKLSMGEAVERYAGYREWDESWMLGRFVVPVARLGEFEASAGSLLPRGPEAEPWRISALVVPPAQGMDGEIEEIFAFNRRHEEGAGEHGAAVIDTIEVRADGAGVIDASMELVPEQLEPFFEIDWREDPRGALAELAGTGGAAKIRTGGVTADLFPPPEAVVRFVRGCADAGVRFKATAGLHHPVRGTHAMTYDAGSDKAVMHGFLNVFLMSAFVRAVGMNEEDACEVLEERDAGAFEIGEEGVTWRSRRLDATRLAQAREGFAVSFGSCSFEEPVDDLRSLGLL